MRKGASVVVILAVLVLFLPNRTIDPWHLLNLRKICGILLALSVIQILGIALSRYLGKRATTLMTGFLSGLISSTMATVALARKSHVHVHGGPSNETVGFLAATVAMLVEGLVVVLMGDLRKNVAVLPIFLLPLVMAGILIAFYNRKSSTPELQLPTLEFQLRPIMELSLFIVFILALSKILLQAFGTSGLMVQTFATSLFEAHGAIIANVQLRDAGRVSPSTFAILLSVSLAATFISKVTLVNFLGTPSMRKKVLKCTAGLVAALSLGWLSTTVFTL